MGKQSKMTIDERAWKQFENALAGGIFVAVGHVEDESKALTPVHGNADAGGQFATFAPGEKPIGGTLRRSQHSVVYINGRKAFGPSADENQNALPAYVTGQGIEGFAGTNIEYAGYVHDGTVKMRPARPFLMTAFVQTQPHFPDDIRAGFQRLWR